MDLRRRIDKKLGLVFTGALKAITTIVQWIRQQIDGEDILFYGGLAAVAYGVDIISREWAFIITGVLLILHAYMPGIYHLIAMFAPGEAPARRGRK